MNQKINDLLTEFDEMGFAPTNVCDNPEGKAKLWKSALVYEIGLLLDEHAAIRKKAVEEFAEKLKKKLFVFFQDNEELDGKISLGSLYLDVIGVEAEDGTIISLGLIDELLKEYEVEE